MQFLLRIYAHPESAIPFLTVKIEAETEYTAERMAMRMMEMDYPGMDWTLTPN